METLGSKESDDNFEFLRGRRIRFKPKRIKKEKGEKKTEVSIPKLHSVEECATDDKQSEDIKHFKSKRLFFKKEKEEKFSLASDDHQDNKDVEGIETNKPLKNISFKRPRIIYEYGEGEDGYKFLAFDKEEVKKFEEEQKPDEYYDTSSEESCEIDYTSEEESDPTTYDYRRYLSIWNEIEQGIGYDSIPLPVHSNNIDDLNKDIVKEFLKTHLNMRRERIRWHPDKMKHRLQRFGIWDNEMEKEVTHVFQIINQAFENDQ